MTFRRRLVGAAIAWGRSGISASCPKMPRASCAPRHRAVPEPLNLSARACHRILELARTLGAEVVRLEGADVARTLLGFARARGARHLVVGAGSPTSLGARLRDRLLGSITERLIREAGGVGIYVMTWGEQDA